MKQIAAYKKHRLESNPYLVYTVLLLITLLSAIGVRGQVIVDPDRVGLVERCCEMNVEFLKTDGVTKIERANTNEFFTVSADIEGDNCRSKWLYKNVCDENFEEIEDVGSDRPTFNHLAEKWGAVLYSSRVDCEGDYDCADGVILPILDWGIWFYNDLGEPKKHRRGATDADLAGFYDPSKPSILFIHGLRQGAADNDLKQDFIFSTLETDPQTGEEITVDINLPALWRSKGFNFVVFNWTQFADEGSLSEAEDKIWDMGSMSWRDPLGDRVLENFPEGKTIGDLVYDAFKDWNPSSNVRIVGHDVGAQLAVELATRLRENNRTGKIQRLVMLNPYWSAEEKSYYLGETIADAPQPVNKTAKRSLQDLLALYKKDVLIETYRNLYFGKEESLPYFGDNNDSIKAITAYADLKPTWLDELVNVPDELNPLLANDKKLHESIYLWYLKSINFPILPELVDSELPRDSEERAYPLTETDCAWETYAGFGIIARTAFLASKNLQKGNKFSRQISGFETIDTGDDRMLLEEFCSCALEPAKPPLEIGIPITHDIAFREYAHCNKQILFVRNPEPGTQNYTTALLTASPDNVRIDDTPAYRPNQYREFTALTSEENITDCGASNGLISIHPDSRKARLMVDRDIEHLTSVPEISREYAHYVFNVLFPRGLYVYPMPEFKDTRWYHTYKDMLAHKKLEGNWKIFADDCYVVKDSLGNVLFNDYKLHGVYNEDGSTWTSEEDALDVLRKIINTQTDANGFDPFGNDGSIRSDIFDNEKIQLIQNGTHDQWDGRNNWVLAGREMGPQANFTVYWPNGSRSTVAIDSIAMQKNLYQCIGITKEKWEELYPDNPEDDNNLYASREGNVSQNSLNIGGYPVVHKLPDDPGRPTNTQREYWEDRLSNDIGAYNFKASMVIADRETFECSAVIGRDSEFFITSFNITDQTPNTTDFVKNIAGEIGLHPHHYVRYAKFASDYDVIVGIRNSNKSATNWLNKMYEGADFRPKPLNIKGKSIVERTYVPLCQEGVNDCGTGNTRILGPGKAIVNDEDCKVCDTECGDLGGLASFDPRTNRGRKIIDPEGKFNDVQFQTSCDNNATFERSYAVALQEKMMNQGFYVYPIPYFANKYQESFDITQVTGLEAGRVINSLQNGTVTINHYYTDQSAEPVHLYLKNQTGNTNLGVTSTDSNGKPEVFGFNGQSQFTVNELATQNTGVFVYAYRRDPMDPTAIGELLWNKPLHLIKPLHSNQYSAYLVDDTEYPVWLDNNETSLPLSHFGNEYISFLYKNLPALYTPEKIKGTRPATNGDPGWNPDNKWDEQSWVAIYYEILHRYFAYNTQDYDPVNWKSNKVYAHSCYIVKNTEGNQYFSDYDGHGYYIAETYRDALQKGNSWYPSWTAQENNVDPIDIDMLANDDREYARELINHYLMQEFPWEDESNIPIEQQETYNTIKSYYTNSGVNINTALGQFPITGGVNQNLVKTRPWDMVQHSPQDEWYERNNYGEAEVNMGPLGNFTLWVPEKQPNGQKVINVYAISNDKSTYNQERLYECLTLNFQSYFPQAFYARSDLHPFGSKIMRPDTRIGSEFDNFPCHYWSDGGDAGCKYIWDMNGIVAGANTETKDQLKQYNDAFQYLRTDPARPFRSLADVSAEEPDISCENPGTICTTLDELRIFSREQLVEVYPNLDLETLYDNDDGVPLDNGQKRLAYTLDEFLAQEFDPSGSGTANTECITGYYSRYVIGEKPGAQPDDPSELMILVTHPYTQEGSSLPYIGQSINDKTRIYTDLLKAMCYKEVDGGWISLAAWDKLDPRLSPERLTFRMTNTNFGELGRITRQGEYLKENTHADNYLILKSSDIAAAGYNISSRMRGPNFPTPGYTGNSPYKLKQMVLGEWEVDAIPPSQVYYNQSPFDRELLEVSFDANGLIKDQNQEVLNVDNAAYVVDCMGRWYMKEDKSFLHSTFLGGAAVTSAGRINIVDGQPVYINLDSGHYLPPCEFLEPPLEVLKESGTLFEKPYDTFMTGICQSWYCNTTSISADFDGTPGLFNNTFINIKRMFVPEKVDVSNGVRPIGSQVKLSSIIDTNITELIYEPDPQNSLAYILMAGQDLSAGDPLLFFDLELEVMNGDTATGTVEINIENCPKEDTDCPTLQDLRSLSREELSQIDTSLGVLYDEDDGVPFGQQKRLAYTFDEFLDKEFEPSGFSMANTECITGYYSRYVIGEKPGAQPNDPNQQMILISHPYTEEDATVLSAGESIEDKTREYTDLLEAMCYTRVDDGWISLAEWSKLLDPNQSAVTLSLRMTNYNFSDRGRITRRGEYLLNNTPAYRYLTDNSLKITAAGYETAEMRGPNFPTPGYEDNDEYKLRQMLPIFWGRDADPNSEEGVLYYNQSPFDRKLLEVSFDTNGLIRDQNQEVLNVDNTAYVVDCMGRLYIAKSGSYSHSEFIGGGAVASAGDIIVQNGRPVFVDVFSGHYKPPCKFLEASFKLLEPNGYSFEEKYPDPSTDVCQAWHCNTITVAAGFDGVPAEFNSGNDPNIPYRRMLAPEKVNVISGTRPVGSQVKLTASYYIFLSDTTITNELIYEPDLQDLGAYTLVSGQNLNAGDPIIFSDFSLQVLNSDTATGTVEINIENCQNDTPVKDCYTLADLRSLSREDLVAIKPDLNLDLGTLYDNDDGVPVGQQKRLAYTLDEFLAKEFDPSGTAGTANTECIAGYYSRYVIGENQNLPDDDSDKLIILISHPYSEEDVRLPGLAEGERIKDKTVNYTDLLQAMCYEEVDSGWISLAAWDKLLDPNSSPEQFSFRMTNDNYGVAGRITSGGEYLEPIKDAYVYLDLKRAQITEAGYNISEFSGPNFPTLGYKGNSEYALKQMELSFWDFDAQMSRYYNQSPFDRKPFKVSFDNELIRDNNQDLLIPEALDYIMDCMGNLYVAKSTTFVHSTFLGGAAVAAPGKIYAVEGKPLYINANSGHYSPPLKYIEQLLKVVKDTTGIRFEKPFKEPQSDFHESWYCHTITISAGFDGAESYFGPIYELDDPTSFLNRSMIVPKKVGVASGIRPLGSQVLLTLDNNIAELIYEADAQDPSAYILAPGQNYNAGDTAFYKDLVLKVLNGGTTTGTVEIKIENCPDAPPADCYTLDRLRELTREDLVAVNPNLGTLHDEDDGVPVGQQKRLAYTLDEFLLQEFEPSGFNTANTECIPGYYSRYVIGENTDLPDNDPNRLIILMSHPYTEEDVAVRNDGLPEQRVVKDKTENFSALLQAMCYELVDSGWVSQAQWHKLDPALPEPGFAFRMTNSNFYEAGRITTGGEHLKPGTSAYDYFTRKSEEIKAFGFDVSEILGPNFPTPKYEENDRVLKQMLTDLWEDDASLTPELLYNQAPFERELFQVTFSADGQILDENQEPVNVDYVSYAQDCMGRLYIAKDDLFSHSQFIGGGALASAGQIIVEDGEPKFVDVFSGHYKPACEFLDVPLTLIESQGYSFEEKHPEPLEGICQAWYCNTITIEAGFDGTPGSFEPGSNPDTPYRRMVVPEKVDVTSGTRPMDSQVRLTTFGAGNAFELFYEPDPGDPTAYNLVSGQALNVGDFVIFSSLTLVVINGGTTTGTVEIKIENCPDAPPADCYTLDRLRELTRDELVAVKPDLNLDLGTLYDNDDGLPLDNGQKRLAYTLDEFLAKRFDPSGTAGTANTECIAGYYSRYVIGENQNLPDDDPDKLIILISHPYSEEDVRLPGLVEGERIEDKTVNYTDLLQAMCYGEVDSGWISLAAWDKLLDPNANPEQLSFRMTNANYSETGRITEDGEYLDPIQESWDYLELKTSEITKAGYEISDLLGPNFPTPGYTGNSSFVLKQMLSTRWETDVPQLLYYNQAPKDRARFEAIFDTNGLIRDKDQILVNGNNLSYVQDCMNRLYIAKDTDTYHSELLGGAAVAASGKINVEDGNPLFINLDSGHYVPPCTFLDQPLSLLKSNRHSFEEKYPASPNDICQAWYCNTVTMTANFDGVPGFFDSVDQVRRMLIPEKIQVITGTRPAASQVKLLSTYGTIGDIIELIYEPDPQDPSTYILAPGQNYNAGDTAFYKELRLKVLNGGTTTGTVEIKIENCPDAPPADCYTLDRLRELTRDELEQINPNLRILYNNDDGVPVGQQKRLAYALDEFLAKEFDSLNAGAGTANTECIAGYYSRYVIGESQNLPDGDPNKLIMLISHPYTDGDVTIPFIGQSINDKTNYYADLLEAMCYNKVDGGWISLATWGKLLDSNSDPEQLSFRMTNANFGEEGRITAGGESLKEVSKANDYMELKAQAIDLAGYDISTIRGPNFPTPGYDGNSEYVLKQMNIDRWDFDVSPDRPVPVYYNQSPEDRKGYLVTFDANGLMIRDENQSPLNVDTFSYVQDCMGQVYVAKNRRIFHSQFLGGASVAASGRISVENGQPVFIDVFSGHYSPPCEFLNQPLSLLESNGHSFEEKYPVPPVDICQSWYCNSVAMTANFDGVPNIFPGLGGPGDKLNRRVFIPEKIGVINGIRPVDSQVTLSILTYIGLETFVNELIYEPDPQDFLSYILAPGQSVGVGDPVIYQDLRLEVVNGGTAPGTVEVKIENCIDNVPQGNLALSPADNKIRLFPNPASNMLSIQFPEGEIVQDDFSRLEILSVEGKVVRKQKITLSDKKMMDVPIPNLEEGIYFVKITHESLKETHKIMVIK